MALYSRYASKRISYLGEVMSVNYSFVLSFGITNQTAGKVFLQRLLERFQVEGAGWVWIDCECDWLIAGEFGKGDSYALIVALVKAIEWKYSGRVQLLIACEYDSDVPGNHLVNIDWENATLPEGVKL